ncbi:NAC domain-containing protein 17-like [Punica granatum]|uniref:NAC domain-containing protein 17-like n=2 Tax=Punica granatum TaxID=22663 RepID=A0A6P8DN07_PUNGR|nr:NAC domain-containing protein 17-like [Punica granatum]PKI54466.1 hypothetical protein CRG98_025149 [Punica granatum]
MTVGSDSSPAVRGSAWPPGFRFHPTDEELILYYLKRKICRKKLRLNIIAELDVYKWDPEELPGHSILKTGDRQWYFFSARDRKYPNGARSNRATRHGYWKATGKDRNITSNSRSVGVKKTLVFYQGKAPSGQRSNWVMHEYTLDEEELKRCKNAKDYYALYKVYKKSGAGPKNGEQYGAPFREEEWADDDSEVVKTVGEEILPTQLPEVTSVDNVTDVTRLDPPAVDDIEELLKQYMPELDDPAAVDSLAPVPVFPQFGNEEEAQSSLFIPPTSEFSVEPVYAFNSNQPLHDLQPSFEFNSLGVSQYQQQEASSVVTFAPENCPLQPQIREEDFLEIDDLIGGPEPSFGNIEKPVEKSPFEEVDGLSELDVFHDAAMFLRDIGPMDQENVAAPDMNLFNYGVVDDGNYQYQVQQNPLLMAQQSANQLWVHDQRGNAFTSWESTQGVQPPPSGFVSDSGNDNVSNANQNQNGGEEVSGRMSRFSSAVWSFVESIPTNPASASENALVSRAFERMSSFSRVRINSVATNVGSVTGAAAVVRRSGKSRRFVLFYVIGVLGALFGVLIGTLRLWERCVSP